jgi:hypothetical protein
MIETDQPEPDEPIRSAMESLADPAVNTSDSATNRQRAEAFRHWANSQTTDAVLSDEEMSRASFYGERG